VSPITEYMVQTGLTLGGIALLGYLLVYAARRSDRGLPKGPMELLATLRLEQRRALYLVRIAERTVVLGASEGGIVTVLELSPSELASVSSQASAKPSVRFGDILSRVLTPSAGRPPSESAGATPPASGRKEPSEPNTRP
jgi:flagellar biogenesis protein FliO